MDSFITHTLVASRLPPKRRLSQVENFLYLKLFIHYQEISLGELLSVVSTIGAAVMSVVVNNEVKDVSFPISKAVNVLRR